jgi:hypothetical protein
MANTFSLIASSTVGASGVALIEFTSIPQTFIDLQLVYSIRESQAAAVLDLNFYFNNSNSGYSERMAYGTGSGAAAANTSGGLINWPAGTGSSATAGTFASGQLYISRYTGSNYKSMYSDSVSETNSANSNQILHAALWSNTSPITSIQIKPQSNTGTLVEYSTAYLYGIKNS